MKKVKQTLKSHYPFYVVFVGAIVGIVKSYREAKQRTEGYPYGRCEGFHTLKEAQDAFNRHANALRDPNAELEWGYTPPPRGNKC